MKTDRFRAGSRHPPCPANRRAEHGNRKRLLPDNTSLSLHYSSDRARLNINMRLVLLSALSVGVLLLLPAQAIDIHLANTVPGKLQTTTRFTKFCGWPNSDIYSFVIITNCYYHCSDILCHSFGSRARAQPICDFVLGGRDYFNNWEKFPSCSQLHDFLFNSQICRPEKNNYNLIAH